METKKNNSFTITNVRVFDGNELTEPRTVVVENGIISSDATTSDVEIDGHGFTLIPGLIDSHIHLDKLENLQQAAKYGVTTMLDMTTSSKELVDSLMHQPGLTDIRSCYWAAISGGGMLNQAVEGMGNGVVTTLQEAERFVEDQLAKGASYIKLILEGVPMTGGMLSQEMIEAVVRATHKHGMLVFAHTTSVEAYRLAIAGGVDVLNHIPRTEVLPDDVVESLVQTKRYVIPTLAMDKGMVDSVEKMMPGKGGNYAAAEESFAKMQQAGVIIVAGTDANHTNQLCFLPHGSTMHDELELMVKAGMSPLEALRSATCIPAKLFEFIANRGSIEPGKRADFVLIKGDPTKDISAVRNIEGVWIEGIHVE